MINPGIYPNLSIEDYHNDKYSISRSKLLDFSLSPYHYWAKHINKDRPPKESTRAMDIGQAYHDFILQPQLFAATYEIAPPRVLLKDVGREKYEAYKEKMDYLENSGIVVLSDNDFKLLSDMKRYLFQNKEAKELIEGATYEQSYFWVDENGFILKCRPDILHENFVVDFKTTRDASPRAFQRAILDYGYHVQAAMIQDGIKQLENRLIENFLYVCQEKEYPFVVGVYILDDEALKAGQRKYNQLKRDFMHAYAKDEWPAYGIQTVSLPEWALKD